MQHSQGTMAEPLASARVVPVVDRHGSPGVAAGLASLLGLVSGLLTFAIVTLASGGATQPQPAPASVLVSLLGGWALAGWLLGRRTAQLHVILRRGLLLGSAQWLALVPLLGQLPADGLPRATEMLRVALAGVPVRLPDQGGALLLSALCLMGALSLTAIWSALGLRTEPAERREPR